ncbi:TPA: isopeptide-forming domain-containing fimbrial protein [Streptococcus equi subsp. zooepidemicus]|uniref:pilin N-terminal domain-containing protein n=1 Tax=Streptococcus equi TaxID=1336 RepID=UPI0013F63D79|nr:pilin N-terminal domain-containing protein [Streptococcus equi]HEL1016140.1 isopeptide-forming domain-containing fimbrial protein [Streptococcus equi subsp. ruminatorum]MCD3382443.1 isopeptide-forming domain-containing fimbrial protein [Streptococcus equi subsp. zooepidemicus]MCD3419709.1 isopeptide-forming domain-containing fimbrial protein [Streptococcus equi subsp. zooepidemicus]MCD3426158.1 isopeptide-forming domain-containing fimbrial protein [Streptococcus equi subsp. zooepidemicus]MD
MKTKIFSRLAAVLLVLGSLLPTAVTVAKAESQRQTDLVIHKIKMTSLVGWPKEKNPNGTYTGDNNQNYNGEKINDISQYFGSQSGAEELDGVSFTYWKIAKKEDYKKLTENPQNYDTVAKVEAFLKNVEKKQTGTTTGKTSNKNGVKVEHLEDGYYWFVENTGSLIANGETLSSGVAVPFGLELPVYKADGSTIKELHVYPKNTTTKPKIDKNFSNEEKDAKLAGGANYDYYQKDKGHVSRTLGSEVSFQIKTEIPAGAQYQTLRWEDTMTKGLTYKNGSLELQITAKGSKFSFDGLDYTIFENQSGFALIFTSKGLEKVKAAVQATKNDKGQITDDGNPMTIELNYKAIVNSDAVVDQFDQNTVVLDYGNNPKAYKDPRDKSTNPKNKQITVNKTWAAQPAPSGVEVTYYLYQKGTTGNEDKVVDSVILTKDYNHTFTNLDDSKEYYVKESAIGYTPEYTSDQDGKISINNTKDDKNPDPLKPTSPAVVTHGKKFVKTSQEDERLQGAAFVVSNQKTGGKYLAIKADNGQNAEEKSYQEAEKKYQEEIKKATTGKPNTLEIEKAKKARDDAFKKARTAYQWVDDKEKAIKLTSNSKGQLELTGLAAGTYYLEELTAPIGFAKLQERVEFKLGFNSYNGHKDSSGQSLEDHIQYEKGTPDFGYAQRVINKKITIPQTGGIGTVIFTIAGLAIMIGSGYVMVRRHRNDKA